MRLRLVSFYRNVPLVNIFNIPSNPMAFMKTDLNLRIFNEIDFSILFLLRITTLSPLNLLKKIPKYIIFNRNNEE